MAAAPAPYWGNLDPPKVSRTTSQKRANNNDGCGVQDEPPQDLGRSSSHKASQYQPGQQSRQNRASIQSQAHSASTMSPFASPTESSFRGEGLAPMPSSFHSGANEPHDQDFLEKRRRRRAREEQSALYDGTGRDPPPAVPQPPQLGPPLSYKQPYSNAGLSSGSGRQPPSRTTSTRRPHIEIDTSRAALQPIQSSRVENQNPSDVYPVISANNNRQVHRNGSIGTRKEHTDIHDARQQGWKTTKKSAGEIDGSRRREFAPERSPLQRLEVTLDSITKEEKRARVQEAEERAREKVRLANENTHNSVRFKNRIVAKEIEGHSPLQDQLPTSVTIRSQSVKKADPREPVVEPSGTRTRTAQDPSTRPTSHNKQSVAKHLISPKSARPEPSHQERVADLPATTSVAKATEGAPLGRTTSNKLKKQPAGDPWYNIRLDAEKSHREIKPRAPPGNLETSERNAAMATERAEPPISSQTTKAHRRQGSYQSTPETYLNIPNKTGETQPRGVNLHEAEHSRDRAHHILPREQQLYADMLDKSEELGPDRIIHPKTLKASQHVTAPNGGQVPHSPATSVDGYHHFSGIHHPHGVSQYHPGDGIYAPSRRLDEWKKAGVASLTGSLIHIHSHASKEIEADMDKTWWEAGNKGKRKTGSTPRYVEAYDGEASKPNGTVFPPSDSGDDVASNTTTIVQQRTWRTSSDVVVPRSRQYIGFQGTSKNVAKVARRNKTFLIHSAPGGSQRTPKRGRERSRPGFPLSSAIFLPYSSCCPSPSRHTIYHPFHICPQNLFKEKHRLTPSTRAIRVPDPTAPTFFKPPLYLKCGPLLRFCGIQKHGQHHRPAHSNTRTGVNNREIWRGSVMIVTADNDSSYEVAPKLRLFVQPTTLLPPPPSQVDGGLDPEYIDPLAGLPKIARDGRTLYVRPVEELEEERDLSTIETDDGLFERTKTLPGQYDGPAGRPPVTERQHRFGPDGEKLGMFTEVDGFRLHAEHGSTFWRFNIEVELGTEAQRIAYRINRGPATGFWVPARGDSMNIMFHSCNGFSLSVNPDQFSGPDPMWRDVLNTHQTQPFHVMIGGGDQVYNDRVIRDTTVFGEWLAIKNPLHKHNAPFTQEMQKELDVFYLDRYSMWFSQGLFSLANSQIPMVNIYDDHDIIDGFGSYPHHFMDSPVFTGLGAIAFKYYMLFQHQSSIDEGEDTEPSWLLGQQPGPYIKEMSRSVFMSMGKSIAFLGLDCRTERTREEVLSVETTDKIFERCSEEIIKGETKHLIVLLGVPIAYPRLVWLENILTSRLMEPVKAMSKAGMFGNFLNKMDGGPEILDDLDDHWTSKNHKRERLHLVQDLQDLAAEKSVRITILGGDVHLAAIGQFFSNPKLGIPKDRDNRYMPNIISSAIVNTPPPNSMADVLNKRNKVHHLDDDTDESMIPIFTHDVDGSKRNNKHLLPRRNWCSIRQYNLELSPPPTPEEELPPVPTRVGLLRRFSSNRGPSFRAESAAAPQPRGGLMRKFSLTGRGRRHSMDNIPRPPMTQYNTEDKPRRSLSLTRAFKPGGMFHRNPKRHRSDNGGINGYGSESEEDDYGEEHYQSDAPQQPRMRGGAGSPSYFPPDGYDDRPTRTRSKLEKGKAPMHPRSPAGEQHQYEQKSTDTPVVPVQRNPAPRMQQQPPPVPLASHTDTIDSPQARKPFHRTPTGMSEKQRKLLGDHEINLEGGLDICLNVEVSQKDPTGITVPYRVLIPALFYEPGNGAYREQETERKASGLGRLLSFKKRSEYTKSPDNDDNDSGTGSDEPFQDNSFQPTHLRPQVDLNGVNERAPTHPPRQPAVSPRVSAKPRVEFDDNLEQTAPPPKLPSKLERMGIGPATARNYSDGQHEQADAPQRRSSQLNGGGIRRMLFGKASEGPRNHSPQSRSGSEMDVDEDKYEPPNPPIGNGPGNEVRSSNQNTQQRRPSQTVGGFGRLIGLGRSSSKSNKGRQQQESRSGSDDDDYFINTENAQGPQNRVPKVGKGPDAGYNRDYGQQRRPSQSRGGIGRLVGLGKKSDERYPQSRSGSEYDSFSEGDDEDVIGRQNPVDRRRSGKGFLAGRL